jgi:chromosome segregation ATPase
VKKEETQLQERLKEVQEMSTKIQKEVDQRAKTVSDAESHMEQVRKKHADLKNELKEEQENLERMIKENEEQEKVIGNLQKTIFERMQDEEKQLTKKEKEIKDIPKRFKEMLASKNQVKELLNVISHEEVELKKEVERLGKEAQMLQLSLGTKEFAKEMEKLNKEIDEVTQKRNFFKKKIQELISLLDWTK